MKKIISVLLACLLLLPYGAAVARAMEDFEIDDDFEIDGELDEDAAGEEEDDGEIALGDEDLTLGGDEEEEEIPWVEYDYDMLEVGHPTVTDGKFFMGCWGNATSDIDVRTLLHSYHLVSWDGDLGFFRFTKNVVSGAVITQNEDGDRTYLLALYDDMYFSDGTPITAWDYAFAALIMIDPKINELGTGQAAKAPFWEGYDEYISGQVPYLAGIRVLSDYLISFTVKHEYLPYFFELYRMGFVPYPIHVIAPGCKVYDDGNGIYIGNEDLSIEEPLFTVDLLQETIMDPETGYLTHPSVVSGPYTLTYYGPREGYVPPVKEEALVDENGEPLTDGLALEDEAEEALPPQEQPEEEKKPEEPAEEAPAEEAENPEEALPVWEGDEEEEEFETLSTGEEIIGVFEINPWFKGDENGDLPHIPRLLFRLGINETMIDQLAEGKFGLLNKVTRQDAILAGIALTGGQFTMSQYPRIGLSFITFVPDKPALQQKNVRQAIAHCLDKDQVVEDYVSDFGIPVDGFFGIGQWMYGLATGTLVYEPGLPADATEEDVARVEANMAALDAIDLSTLKHYDLDTDKAIQLLEEAGWVLNEEGQPYVKGRDGIRYKKIDGELTGLDFKMGYPYTNVTALALEEMFLPYLEEAGIHVELVPMEMKDLHIRYDFRAAEDVDIFYLGDDFNIEFDPTLWFIPGDGSDPEQDNLAWVHAKMYDMADWMCRTEPYDIVTFMQKWLAFQQEFSELLPIIPVYGNVYFDFFTRELHNYEITNYVTWGEAIVPAFMDVYDPAAEAEEEEEELGEGEIILD